MNARLVGVLAPVLLVAAFVVDALTPQTLVIAILSNVPIVMASLSGGRRLIVWLVSGAIVANAAAAVIDAARDAFRWDLIGIEDRALAMLSIVLVGFLSIEVHKRAERVARLSAQEASARRAAMMSTVAERIRSSLSVKPVLAAIVQEATGAIGGTGAAYCSSSLVADMGVSADGLCDQCLADLPPSTHLNLIQSFVGVETTRIVRALDLDDKLILERLGARSAVAVPLSDRSGMRGVLFVAFSSNVPTDVEIAAAEVYFSIANNALAQAQLLDELTERNVSLSHHQAVIEDLVDAISHDLRTPLTALSLTMRHAIDGAYGLLPNEYVTLLRDSLVSINDLQRLADTLLIVARVEAGQSRASPEQVDLADVAREVSSELHGLSELRSISLLLEAHSRAVVLGSRGDLRRAVSNLVANALQHTPPGGTVALVVDGVGDHVEVVVQDDGYGIDPELRHMLFQRFSPGSAPSAGTGLGLYIVRRIAEESGGTVSYEARAPRGSAFRLTLPRAA
jgi:signal transduction histidine kinase